MIIIHVHTYLIFGKVMHTFHGFFPCNRSISFEAALAVEGVVDVVTAKDVPGSNNFGVLKSDEELFATDKVKCKQQFCCDKFTQLYISIFL